MKILAKNGPVSPVIVTPEERAADGLIPPRRFALLLVILILGSYPDVIFHSQCFFLRDFGLFGYPLAAYHRECFWRGEIPLWNPLNSCGVPFLAQWNSLVLYPLSLIYLMLPLPWSVSYYCLFHLFLAGMGMYFLARRWSGHTLAAAIAGAGYAFNGLALNSLAWPNNIAALAWMPWVVLTAEKAWQRGGKYTALAALAGGMQMLAGAPEMILLTWSVIGLIFCFQLPGAASRGRATARFGSVILLVGCLSAAQLLPFLDLLEHSQRDAQFGGSTWSMPAWGWANLVVPLFRFYQSPSGVFFQSAQYWTSSYFFGVGILTLAIAGAAGSSRYAVPLVFASLLGLILALGSSGWLYPALLRAFPFLGFMRFPIKFVILPMYCLPLLAALGTAATLSSTEKPRGIHRIPWVWICVGVALIAGGIAWYAQAHPYKGELPQRVLWNAVSRVGILAGFVTTILLVRRSRASRLRTLLALAAVVLVWVDGITHAPNQNPTISASAFEPGMVSSQLSPTPKLGYSRAMMSRQTHDKFYFSMLTKPAEDYIGRRVGLFGNCNLLDDLPVVDGFYSLYLKEQRAVWSAIFYSPSNAFPEGLVDFLGVSQLTHRTNLFEWETRPTWEPLVTLGRQPVFLKESDIIPMLMSKGFDPRAVILAPVTLKGKIPLERPARSRVVDESYEAERIQVEVDTDKPCVLSIAQSFSETWVPRVDGRKVELLRLNHAFQGLVVPAGRHHVEVKYEDDCFRGGVLVSLAALVLCLWMLWRFGRRRGREPA